MTHQLIVGFAVVVFAVSAWRSAAPEWPRLVSVGLTLLAASFLQW